MSSSRGASKKPKGAPHRARSQPPKPPAASSKPRRFSARLTIKPGSPQAQARPQLVFSSKPRPGGPRRLSDVPLDEDEFLIDAFEATLEGASVRITAVLERTCVYMDRDGNRRLASKKDVWVETDELSIRRRGIG